jgi:hypothetical protein
MYAGVMWKKRLFVSMNIIFRELKSYYSLEVISLFGDSLDIGGMRREGESCSDGEMRIVTVGGVGCPIRKDSAVVEPKKEDSTVVEIKVERNEPNGSRTQAQGESRYGEVYVRRKKLNEEVVSTVSLVSSLLSISIPTLETHALSTLDSEYTSDMADLSTPLIPILIRRTSHENVGVPPDDMISHMTLLNLSLTHIYHLYTGHSLHH